MESVSQEDKTVFSHKNCSNLLELAAADDLPGFIHEIEEKGSDINESSFWYGKSFGSRKMGFEKRTPLMIASLYGSTQILKYIVTTGKADVSKSCGSDRSTPLHCAAAGGSLSSVEAVKLLIDASADVDAVDANGMRPSDMIAPCVKLFSSSPKKKALEMLLNGCHEEEGPIEARHVAGEKKEYPMDVPLPDINNGVYGSDEFRMYSFKVKPCSRAYSHDWTECPFVHPGENARRRDPVKYSYTCVPCPEFKKGSCGKGDACEYAHGVFESWLHPAQYRTRLCKDETGCSRRVCFFAHRPEELRPLYASTGSGLPSPKPISGSPMDLSMLSPLSLGLPKSSTPPMSPAVGCSSPMGGGGGGGGGWQSKAGLTPPALQLPGSRLKTASSARDVELEKIRTQMASLSSPYSRTGDLNPTNLEDVFGSLDSMASNANHHHHHLRASYPSNHNNNNNISSRKPVAYGFDSSAAVAAAVMNSRSASFAKRSQSFVDRPGVNYRAGPLGSPNSPGPMPVKMSGWGSPDGKLDWGFNGEEVSKLRKSASFGLRSGPAVMGQSDVDEPDVSWVNSLVKDVPSGSGRLYSDETRRGGVHDMMMVPHWVDQMYMEQEQMVA
ncbi:zinc finger CCCH domain-containing protein 29 [Phtheirospermum japonicum]|uniref:Zinc finger CCCH domain-containing protein 29 n=1 Tax=Phtheirospermum japonicum TaxID=374723 RepID=A0A830BV00_9LAMI|nr:zinc finger CCCH domain-containing protein 29 [Phtheirospermum japonicum]